MASLFIVVIDDSPTIRKILEIALSREGYQVQMFSDSVSATKAILVKGDIPMPDVLIVDLQLPHISGYELIRLFRKHHQGKLVPIILISQVDGVIERLKARLAGAAAYLPKPLKTQDVIALIKTSTTRQPE
jgi:twitching motility two-component system response regulator PilG